MSRVLTCHRGEQHCGERTNRMFGPVRKGSRINSQPLASPFGPPPAKVKIISDGMRGSRQTPLPRLGAVAPRKVRRGVDLREPESTENRYTEVVTDGLRKREVGCLFR